MMTRQPTHHHNTTNNATYLQPCEQLLMGWIVGGMTTTTGRNRGNITTAVSPSSQGGQVVRDDDGRR
jgi:hypothetical protein